MSTRHVIKDKRIRLFNATAGVIIMLMMFACTMLLLQRQSGEGVNDYSENWTVVYHGKRYENVNLHDFVLSEVPARNDVLTLTKRLDKDIPPDSSVMMITYLSKVTISYDDIPLYHYGREDEARGRMVGSGYHYFRIHPFMLGKELKIEIMAAENGAFTSVDPIYMMPTDRLMTTYAKRHAWSMFSSIFLFMLGVCLVGVSIVPVDTWMNRARLTLIGAFALLMGLWTMGSVKFLQLLSSDLTANSEIEYLSLFLAPLPLFLLICRMRREAGGWQYKVMQVVTACFAAADAFFIVLHFSGIAHFCISLTMFHVIAALSLLVTIISGIRPLHDMNKQERFMNLGLTILFVFGGLDLVRFNLQKYFFPNRIWLAESILPVGSLIFIVFLLIGYLMYLYDIMKKETERQTLTNLAYRDPMTGLYNRASIFEVFKQSLDVGEQVYLLLFDVNGLKRVNDTMGHTKGDELIATFAKVLMKTFGKFGSCARIGGDEFVVLVPGEHGSKIEAALEKFTLLEVTTSQETGFKIRAAYGQASSEEVSEKTTDEMYRLADSRMYAMKQRMKANDEADFRD
ncbi:MAG: GGDEF domain-containing protein [Lachnospiraceae bacterium]|nr:GGDEF domain-containing protein [Lachnospiraceae bacterium]